jgi:hypothetical protein
MWDIFFAISFQIKYVWKSFTASSLILHGKCKKSKISWHSTATNRQSNIQTKRLKDEQTDRQTDKQTYKKKSNRQTGTHTNGKQKHTVIDKQINRQTHKREWNPGWSIFKHNKKEKNKRGGGRGRVKSWLVGWAEQFILK